jgi:hypothetical protein
MQMQIMRKTTYRNLLASVAIFGSVCGCALFPTDHETATARGISDYVAAHYSFSEKLKSDPKQSSFFCMAGTTQLFGPTPYYLEVYSVTNKEQQDALIKVVREYKAQKEMRTIIIRFYPEENWTVTKFPDGSAGGFRGKEKWMRKEWIR